jgi:peptidoglycan/xylan/chitin deacetylase (PgdA/CDA1 family)
MDVSEANNLQSAFYFICGRTDPVRDGDYELEHPAIRNLMRRIRERGHEIGLHPSYGTFQKPELIKKEADRLRRVCAEERIEQPQWGGRMHFLRWEQNTTLRGWADAGMSYDSTMGYADRPGFRCGTCHEYPAFDAVEQKHLSLRVRPLVVMECTVVAERYMGLGIGEEAEHKFELLKKRCINVFGVYTLLWHNSYFLDKSYFQLYQKMLINPCAVNND